MATLIALAVVAVALINVGAPGACDGADQLRENGRLSEAREAYVALLDDRPRPECATTGVRTVARRQCRAASRLAKMGQAEEAKKAYLALAGAEPFGARKCLSTALTPPAATCEGARKVLDRGLLTKARASYVGLLESDETARCAAEALAEINRLRCAQVRRLRDAGFPNRARKLAGDIATEEPYGIEAPCSETNPTEAQ